MIDRARAHTGVDESAADQNAPLRSGAYELDNTLRMLRCVVAAETYRVTGQLPGWVADE